LVALRWQDQGPANISVIAATQLQRFNITSGSGWFLVLKGHWVTGSHLPLLYLCTSQLLFCIVVLRLW